MRPSASSDIPPTCPGQEQLRAFNNGSLPPEEMEAIAAHARGCPQCRRLLDEEETPAAAPPPVAHQSPFAHEAGCRQAEEAVLRMAAGGAAPAPTPPRPDPMIGKVIGDKYRMEEKVGQGGMGAVYRAQHVHLENFKVALLDPRGGNGLARDEEICYSPQTSQDEGRQGGLPWQARRRRW